MQEPKDEPSDVREKIAVSGGSEGGIKEKELVIKVIM